MWLFGRQMERWRSDDAHRVASRTALCYEFVTVLSWFAVRAIRAVENGSQEAIDLDRYRSHAKKFSGEFPFKINTVSF